MLNEPDNASFHFSDLDITLKKSKFVAIPAYMQMKKRILKLMCYFKNNKSWLVVFTVFIGNNSRSFTVIYYNSYPSLLIAIIYVHLRSFTIINTRLGHTLAQATKKHKGDTSK